MLTNQIIIESKKEFLSKVKPDLVQSKKRKRKNDTGEVTYQFMEEF
jgi:hypothetical protein